MHAEGDENNLQKVFYRMCVLMALYSKVLRNIAITDRTFRRVPICIKNKVHIFLWSAKKTYYVTTNNGIVQYQSYRSRIYKT